MARGDECDRWIIPGAFSHPRLIKGMLVNKSFANASC